tara:strand:- start:1361 stop:1507 length:147 start_codon:yes stop_codon:yes gene_type:complete
MSNKTELIEELKTIAGQLDGTLQELYTSDHSGRTSKKIVIEYDIKEKT